MADLKQITLENCKSEAQKTNTQFTLQSCDEYTNDVISDKLNASDLYSQTLFELVQLVGNQLTKVFSEGHQFINGCKNCQLPKEHRTSQEDQEDKNTENKTHKEHANFCRMFTKQYLRLKKMDEYKKREPKFTTAFTDLITYVYSNLQNLLRKRNQSTPLRNKSRTLLDEPPKIEPTDTSKQAQVKQSLTKGKQGMRSVSKNLHKVQDRIEEDQFEDEVEYENRRGTTTIQQEVRVQNIASDSTAEVIKKPPKMQDNKYRSTDQSTRNKDRKRQGSFVKKPPRFPPTIMLTSERQDTPESSQNRTTEEHSKYARLRQLADESVSGTTYSQARSIDNQSLAYGQKSAKTEMAGMLPQINSKKASAFEGTKIPQALGMKKSVMSPLVYQPRSKDVLCVNETVTLAARKIKQKQMLANMKQSKTPAMAYKIPQPMVSKDSKMRNSEQVRQSRSIKNGGATERGSLSSHQDSSTQRETSLLKMNSPNLDKLKVKFVRKKQPELLQDKLTRDVNAQYGVSHESQIYEKIQESDESKNQIETQGTIINNNSFIITINKGGQPVQDQSSLPQLYGNSMQSEENFHSHGNPTVRQSIHQQFQRNILSGSSATSRMKIATPERITQKKDEFAKSKSRFFQDQQARVEQSMTVQQEVTARMTMNSSRQLSEEKPLLVQKKVESHEQKHLYQQQKHFKRMVNKHETTMSSLSSQRQNIAAINSSKDLISPSKNVRSTQQLGSQFKTQDAFSPKMASSQRQSGGSSVGNLHLQSSVDPVLRKQLVDLRNRRTASHMSGQQMFGNKAHQKSIAPSISLTENKRERQTVPQPYGDTTKKIVPQSEIKNNPDMIRSDIQWLIENNSGEHKVLSDDDDTYIQQQQYMNVKESEKKIVSPTRGVTFQDHIENMWKAGQESKMAQSQPKH